MPNFLSSRRTSPVVFGGTRDKLNALSCHHQLAEIRVETFSKCVVEFANAIPRLVVNERHVLLHAIDAPSWRAERRRGTPSISILEVGVVPVSDVGWAFVVPERVHKRGIFLRREKTTVLHDCASRFPSSYRAARPNIEPAAEERLTD